MYEFFEDDKRYYLVTEICKGGELFDEVLARGKFCEKDAAVLIKQVLSCVNYCHKNNIVHRDLKPENILLEQGKQYDQIKMIDFGTSLVYDPAKKLDEKLGTPYYIAPEVLNKNYSSKCDIWSCGVITYILLSGVPPFNGQSDQEIMKKVKAGQFRFEDKCWNAISDNAKDFIRQLLTYDQEKRPTAEQILQHPWVTELSNIEIDEAAALGALNNLKGFRADQTLKAATYAFIASQLLSKKEKDELARVFKAFDKNGDGKLSVDEVKGGYLNHYGRVMSDEDVEKMFRAVDSDNSGFIDYSEFVVAAMNEQALTTKDKLQAAFKMFDKDGSGVISADEIKEVLGFGGNLDKEAIDMIMKQVDENGDGQISFEEFECMMKSVGE
jgi:calcium-dependent protein kinase